MANLVIDIGNTYTKAAVFEQDELIYTQHYKTFDETILNTFLTGYKIDTAVISSVKNSSAAWEPGLKEKVQLIHFNPGMASNIRNHYRTPQTLGPDRLAGVIGAHYLYPGK